MRYGLIGSLPVELGQLTKLQQFSISGNQMSGEVPDIWTSFPDVQDLIFSNNALTGPLPAIPDGLTLFYAAHNQFSASIPESWRDVQLSNVDISNNNLTGNLDIFST